MAVKVWRIWELERGRFGWVERRFARVRGM